jgi:hypothetical protein
LTLVALRAASGLAQPTPPVPTWPIGTPVDPPAALVAVAGYPDVVVYILRLEPDPDPETARFRGRFHHYEIQTRRRLDLAHTRRLLALLLDPHSYDRNTFSCDCFPDYGIEVRSSGGRVELMVDRANLREVTTHSPGRVHSWSGGVHQQIADLCAVASLSR